MSDISLWPDYYSDIYSDFDTRHYLKRRIADDFLYELKMTSKHKEGIMENPVLLLPKEKEKEESEELFTEAWQAIFKNNLLLSRIRPQEIVTCHHIFCNKHYCHDHK